MKGLTARQIMENVDMMNPAVKLYPERFFDPESVPYLAGKKLEQGVNKPYELQKKFYVVKVTKITRLTKLEYKDGWFEEYFPDKKLKRRAFYKKDVMTEEHVFDENGREIKTFGVEPPSSGDEDDAVPTDNKKKKKKKSKKPKSAEPEKP
jgi:5'(3')-deoxyribonucleotidase